MMRLILALLLVVCASELVQAQTGNDRPTMVVAETRVEPANRQAASLGLTVDIRSGFESAIRETRRFRMLERDEVNLGAILDEQALEASDFSNTQNARSGALVAAGYVAVPYITSFSLGASFQPLDAFPGMYDRRDYAEVTLALRVIDATTGELVWTGEATERYSRLFEAIEGRNGGPPRSVASSMTERLVTELAARMINGIYPIMVADVSGNEVYLNRGGDGVSIGDRFDVYAQGRRLIDPATGEPLGGLGANVERRIGRIEVTRVEERFSISRIIDGNASDFAIGAIARPAN